MDSSSASPSLAAAFAAELSSASRSAAAAVEPGGAGAGVEIVGGFDADGRSLGPVERPVIMRPEESGVYGQAGHVFFVGGGRAAAAVRSRSKASWPGGLDFTAAGVSAPGETELATALREAREETGVDLDPNQLRPIFAWAPRDGYCSRGVLYAYPWDPRRPIPFNPADIEEIRWLTLAELVEAARSPGEMKTDLRLFLLAPAGALLGAVLCSQRDAAPEAAGPSSD